MYKVSIYRNQLEKMQHDKSLTHLYPANNEMLQQKMSDEEFEEFLKTNNLIVYHNHLKNYQDGIVCGEFTVI
ncbi:MAG: hypothetical protein ACXVP2_11395 [Tumebacillaceae bacterium]